MIARDVCQAQPNLDYRVAARVQEDARVDEIINNERQYSLFVGVLVAILVGGYHATALAVRTETDAPLVGAF